MSRDEQRNDPELTRRAREVLAGLSAMLRMASAAPGERVTIESTLVDDNESRPVLYIRRGGHCLIAATPEAAFDAIARLLALEVGRG